MAAIINAARLADINTGYKANFNKGRKAVTPVWEKLATYVSSDSETEKYAWLGDFPQVRKFSGERFYRQLSTHDYSIKNEEFELTVTVPMRAIKNDKHGIYAPKMAQMGRAITVFPDRLIFKLIQDGQSEKCFDKKPFFAANHKVGKDDVSNLQAGSGSAWYLLDTSQELKPFIYQEGEKFEFVAREDPNTSDDVFNKKRLTYAADGYANVGFGFWQQAFCSLDTLNETNLDTNIAAMMGVKTDEGEPMGVMPTLLLCGPSNRAAALNAVKNAKLANGGDNHNYNVVDVLVSPYLP